MPLDGEIESDKRNHLCIESIEHQSVTFGAASLRDARVIRKNVRTVEGVYTTYSRTDEDAAYDLGLRKFDIGVEGIYHPLSTTGLLKKNDQLAEAKLLKKYKCLQFYDPPYDVKYTFYHSNLSLCVMESFGCTTRIC
jgi:hypothetical protein